MALWICKGPCGKAKVLSSILFTTFICTVLLKKIIKNHAELVVDENGKYYELWNAQAQYYTEK